MKIYHKILVLPDTHLPFADKKAIKKIAEFNKKFKADLIIQLGDLIDAHSWSRWPKDTAAMSPDHEFSKAQKQAKWLHSLFPKMTILQGNHDSRSANKRVEASIPRQFIKGFSELFPYSGWTFQEPRKMLIIETPTGKIGFVHGDESGGTPLIKAKTLGHSLVQGHTHRLSIEYFTGSDGKTIFGCMGGHLVNLDSYAMSYAAGSLSRGTTAFVTIESGVPTGRIV